MLHSVAWQPNMHCPFDDAEKAESKAVDPQMNTPYSRTLMVEFALIIVDLTVCWRVKRASAARLHRDFRRAELLISFDRARMINPAKMQDRVSLVWIFDDLHGALRECLL